MEAPARGQLPRYAQVKDHLRHELERRLRPGALLPTQKELAQRYETSLITIKRAISELEREGWLVSIRGKGAVIHTRPRPDYRGGVTSWTDSMNGTGGSPQTAWAQIGKRIPPANIRHRLGLRARAMTAQIKRLRMDAGLAICLMHNEIPLHFVPGFLEKGLRSESLYECLRADYGLVPVSALEEVSAHEATAEQRRLLDGVKCVLHIERTTYLADKTPFEFAQVIAHAGRYRYQVELFNHIPKKS